MQEIRRILFVAGLVITGVGLMLWKLGGRLPFGKLPGDIAIQKEHFSLYIPITTCLLISIVLSLLLRLFSIVLTLLLRLFRR